MASYAVLRIAKFKTMSHIAGHGVHIERERETRNADEERRTQNERLAGTGDWCADVERRLTDAPTIRKNAVLSIEHVITASPPWYRYCEIPDAALWDFFLLGDQDYDPVPTLERVRCTVLAIFGERDRQLALWNVMTGVAYLGARVGPPIHHVVTWRAEQELVPAATSTVLTRNVSREEGCCA